MMRESLPQDLLIELGERGLIGLTNGLKGPTNGRYTQALEYSED